MSYRATAWAWQQKLPALQKLTLLALADRHNNDTGQCNPSMQRVAEDCGMSRESVRTAVRALEEKGLIQSHQRRDGSTQLSNFYTFVMAETSTPTKNTGGSPPPYGIPPSRNSGTNQEVEPVIEPGNLLLTPSSEKRSTDDLAEEIYEAYPRHVAKPAAIQKIKKALKSHSYEFLLERTKAYAVTREREDPQFTPFPATWFNQGRFLDDHLANGGKQPKWRNTETGEVF